MRVLIYTPDFNWTGGADLLINFIEALNCQQEKKIDIHLGCYLPHTKQSFRYKLGLLATKNPRKILVGFFKNKIRRKPKKHISASNEVHSHATTFDINEYLANQLRHLNIPVIAFQNLDKSYINKIIAEHKIDVVFPLLTNKFVEAPSVNWVGYIFDYVYKYLPQLYTEKFCFDTDIMFTTNLAKAKSIVVNSTKTKNDVIKFHPYADASRIFALPFAPFVSPTQYTLALQGGAVLQKFNLVENEYFIVSNQLWLHKNHEVVFQALALFNKSFPNVKLICTGTPTDLSGNNNRLNQLRSLANQLKIKVIFAGLIPREEQLHLICKSICLIQPTLFEGGPGGGSVYLSIAVNKQTLLSHIEVNLEIPDNELITYFDPHSPTVLADKMHQLYNTKTPYKAMSIDTLNSNNSAALKLLGRELIRCLELSTNN